MAFLNGNKMDDEYIFKVTIKQNDDNNFSVLVSMDGFLTEEDAEHAATMLLSVLDGETDLEMH